MIVFFRLNVIVFDHIHSSVVRTDRVLCKYSVNLYIFLERDYAQYSHLCIVILATLVTGYLNSNRNPNPINLPIKFLYLFSDIINRPTKVLVEFISGTTLYAGLALCIVILATYNRVKGRGYPLSPSYSVRSTGAEMSIIQCTRLTSAGQKSSRQALCHYSSGHCWNVQWPFS